MEKNKYWEIIPHTSAVADTGDYDVTFEVTNGDISLFTSEEDEELLSDLVNHINASCIKFYTNSAFEIELRMEQNFNAQLKLMLEAGVKTWEEYTDLNQPIDDLPF